MVPMVAASRERARSGRPRSCSRRRMRSTSSAAAFRVKVTAIRQSGGMPSSMRARTKHATSSRVLPLPAPAVTRTRSLGSSTAASWILESTMSEGAAHGRYPPARARHTGPRSHQDGQSRSRGAIEPARMPAAASQRESPSAVEQTLGVDRVDHPATLPSPRPAVPPSPRGPRPNAGPRGERDRLRRSPVRRAAPRPAPSGTKVAATPARCRDWRDPGYFRSCSPTRKELVLTRIGVDAVDAPPDLDASDVDPGAAPDSRLGLRRGQCAPRGALQLEDTSDHPPEPPDGKAFLRRSPGTSVVRQQPVDSCVGQPLGFGDTFQPQREHTARGQLPVGLGENTVQQLPGRA